MEYAQHAAQIRQDGVLKTYPVVAKFWPIPQINIEQDYNQTYLYSANREYIDGLVQYLKCTSNGDTAVLH